MKFPVIFPKQCFGNFLRLEQYQCKQPFTGIFLFMNIEENTPTIEPDLSTPEKARAAFIAGEIFNRKY